MSTGPVATRIYYGVVGRPILIPLTPFDSKTAEADIDAIFSGATISLVWTQTTKDDNGVETTTTGTWTGPGVTYINDEDYGRAIQFIPAAGDTKPSGVCDVYISINGTVIDAWGSVKINFFSIG